ncbi:hypothetical protein D3C85_1940390 [compost metagenome]
MMPEGFLAFFECEKEAVRAKARHKGTDYARVEYVRADKPVAELGRMTAAGGKS